MKFIKIAISIILFLSVIFIGSIIITSTIKIFDISDLSKIEQYSSIFGNVCGPILSLISITLVVATIYIQIKELNETREEMSRSTKALQDQQEEKQKEVILAINTAKKEDYHRAIAYLSSEIKSLMSKRLPHPKHSLDDTLENLLNDALIDPSLMKNMLIDYQSEIIQASKWYNDLLEKCYIYDGISEAKISQTVKDNFKVLEDITNV